MDIFPVASCLYFVLILHYFLDCGKVGRVKVVFQNADVKVEVGGQSRTYNPYCLKPAPGERLSESCRCNEQLLLWINSVTPKCGQVS